MSASENASSAAAIRRKLRALAAVLRDPAATGPEKSNAEEIAGRLEKRLAEEAVSEGPWTDMMFRLGQGVKEIRSQQPAPKDDWTDHVFRLGRMLREGLKR
jgi:hypothetical protein